MRLRVITEPEALITVADAANFMRVDFPDDEEVEIETMISAARQWVEEYLRVAIGIQTLELVMNGFPANGIILLRPPILSVTSITYTDPDGVSSVIDSADYVVAESFPAEVRPVSSWPAARNSGDSVVVRFQTGYYESGSPSSELLPRSIRTAILMQTADLYQNREAQTDKPLSANATLERLLSPHRLEMGI